MSRAGPETEGPAPARPPPRPARARSPAVLLTRAVAPAVRGLDRLLVRAYGLRPISGEGYACGEHVLRVRTRRTQRALELGAATVPAGASVLELHLCNERADGPATRAGAAAWAARLLVRYRRSCRALARRMIEDPALAAVAAVGGVSSLFAGASEHGGGARLVGRLGFETAEHRSWALPLFFQRLYAWALLGAYAPGSLEGRRFGDIVFTEFWMTRSAFLDRFGSAPPGGATGGRDGLAPAPEPSRRASPPSD